MEDFFISYNKADRVWASGIGDWLDQAGYTTIIQERDFAAGSNFVSEMHTALQNAKRLILVLSPDFLQAKFPEAEWTAALASDPTGERRTVIPVRIRECRPEGLLKPIRYIDLVGLSEIQARKVLLDEISVSLKMKHRKASRRGRGLAVPSMMDSGKVNQTISGDGNYVAGGDFIMYQKPPIQKIMMERRPDAITREQGWQIHEWIKKLVELTTNKSQTGAFKMWGARLKKRFKVSSREALAAEQFEEVESWYRQQAAILTKGLKRKAPNTYLNRRYGAIHRAMAKMGVEKLTYYRKVAARLKIPPFESLKELTNTNLERVYTMAIRDVR
jgi:hypothetical protein